MNRWNSLTLLGLLLAMGHIRAAPPLSGNDERFAQGMTVLFPGEQALHFRLRSDPLPDEGQGGAVKDLQLGPPLDLWILDADKNQLSVEDAKLTGPGGTVVSPAAAGHWRVNRPKVGYYDLEVDGPAVPWRLWSAFHPFMVRVVRPVTLNVASPPAAVFLYPARSRLDLRAPGPVVIGDDEKATWLAFLPWDLFEPSRPDIRIEGNTVLEPGAPLVLKAIVTDPDGDVDRIVWHLPDGETHEGPELNRKACHFQTWSLKVSAQDREGTTAGAEAEITPPPLHAAELPGIVIVQAEDFSGQDGGRVAVTDRGANVGKMITKWHHDLEHWLEWQLDVENAGAYQLYARYATGGSETRRELTIDGASPGDPFASIAFPKTGGYGRRAREWRTRLLGPPVVLTPGKHALRMTNLGDGLALDYLALVPVLKGGK